MGFVIRVKGLEKNPVFLEKNSVWIRTIESFNKAAKKLQQLY